MTTRFWLLIAVSVLTVAACIAIPLIPEAVQPINATSLGGDDPAMEVLPSSLGVPLPPGLHAGDKLYLSDMTPETRSFFMVGGSNPPRGTSIDLPVRNPDGSIRHVQAQFAPTSFLNGNAVNMATEIAGYLLTQLLGCIYLGPRPAEAYSAEERQLFDRVAHQVAVALHALRLEAQRRLLEELADGTFNSLPTAQAKAKELMQASATG